MRIRRCQVGDAAKLPVIERSAGKVFSTLDDLSWIGEHGVHSVEEHLESIARQAHWVAVDECNEPVGFIMTQDLPESLFIHELSVCRKWQGQGIGKKLVQTVIDEAKVKKYSLVTLTTFRHVPWNAPFYQRMGFVILSNSAIPTSLQTILDREVAQCGFKRETRCAMNFVL